ncbi:MAG: MFS transporter [Dehalococcoidia bacterium]
MPRVPGGGATRHRSDILAVSDEVAPPIGRLQRLRGAYYGWYLLAGSVVAMALGSGVSFWSFGLYVEPLEAEFGWSRAEVSAGFSIGLLVSGLVGPMIGRAIDVRGPRVVILVGAVLTALTYVLLATTATLWQWYLYSSINAIFRQMMFFIPFQALVSRWFDRRRGVALSILGSGFSLGGFVVVPVMGLVIEKVGWDGSFIFSGVAIAVVFLPIGFLLVKNAPGDIGVMVDGDPAPADGQPPPPVGGIPLGRALRTPNFWLLAAALMLFFYGMFGWLVHQIPFYESEGMSRRTASLIVATAAGSGIVARLLFGIVADRIQRFEYAAIALAATLFAALFTLLVNTGPLGIAIFLMFWIIGASAGPMMEAMLLTRSFGVAHFATILGAVVVVETMGQILSPTIAGAIYDRTGSYDWALVMFICTFTASAVLFTIASRLPRPYTPVTGRVERIVPDQG